jgi:hypothetical protein
LEKLIQAIRDIVFLSEQSRRNTEEIKELRKRNEDLTMSSSVSPSRFSAPEKTKRTSVKN